MFHPLTADLFWGRIARRVSHIRENGGKMEIVHSINGVPVRLTEERWDHIVSNKPYMESYYEHILDAIERPDYILRGHDGTLVAILVLGRVGYLHVVYRELGDEDGYIVTAFIAHKLNRSMILWRRNS